MTILKDLVSEILTVFILSRVVLFRSLYSEHVHGNSLFLTPMQTTHFKRQLLCDVRSYLECKENQDCAPILPKNSRHSISMYM